MFVSYNDFVAKVKDFEGMRVSSYRCPSGTLTIGYGHTHGVLADMRISEPTALSFLYYDLSLASNQLVNVSKVVDSVFFPYSLYLALTDFVFNFGITKYKNSTLRKVVESIDYKSRGLSDTDKQRLYIQFMRWTKANGKELKGLVKRREWECSLFMND